MLRVFSDEYRTHRDLYRKGFVRVGVARAEGSGVWGEERASAVRWIEDPTPVLGARRGVARVAEFLDAAEVQRRLAESGADRWAPVHEIGRLDDGGAYYATDAYATSAAALARARFRWDEANSEALRRIVREVLHGLGEIQSKRGRGHGNLRAGNILIESLANLAETRVFLSDPAPQSAVGSAEGSRATEHDDLRALGQVLHRMILHKRFRVLGGWPLVEGPEWDAFDGGRANGPLGSAWRELVGWLLDPAADPSERSLLLAHEKLRAIPKPKPKDRWKVPTAVGAAAALLLAVGGVTLGPPVKAFIDAILAEYKEAVWTDLVTAYSRWGEDLERFVRATEGNEHAEIWAAAAESDPELLEIAALVRELEGDDEGRGYRTIFSPWKLLVERGDQKPKDWTPEQLIPNSGAIDPATQNQVLNGYTVTEAKKTHPFVLELASRIDRWSGRERLREFAAEFRGRGWSEAAGYLSSLDEALAVPRDAAGNPVLAEAALGREPVGEVIAESIAALRAAERIERSYDAVAERAAVRISGVGEEAFSQFKQVADAELREAQSGARAFDYTVTRPPADALALLAERAKGLDGLSSRLGDFAAAGWARVDAGAFRAGSEARRAALERPSSEAIAAALAEAASGTWDALPASEDPRRGADLSGSLDRLAGLGRAHSEHPGLDEAGRAEVTRLDNLIGQARDTLSRAGELPWVRGQRESIEAGVASARDRMERAGAIEQGIDAQLDAYEEVYIARLKSEGVAVTSEALRSTWDERLASLDAAFEADDNFRVYHDATTAWREYLAKLDGSVPPLELSELPVQPKAWSLDPLAEAVRTYRETMLSAAVGETAVEAGGPSNAAEVLARADERMGEYRSWLGDVTRMAGDFARAESLLDSGRTPWEPDGSGASADALVSGWTDSPVFDEARADEAFAPVLARLARADGVRRSADATDLARLAVGEGEPEPMIAIAAWRRLGELAWPTNAEQLLIEQRAGEHLTTLADGLPEVGQSLRAEVAGTRAERWARVAAAARTPDELSALLDLELEVAFGVDRAALTPRVRYNLARHTLGRYVGREFDASEDQIAEVMRETVAAAYAFERESPAEAGGLSSLASQLDAVLREAETVERLDFSKVGPGVLEGWASQDNDLQTDVVFSTPGEDGATLGFKLVYYDGSDEAFFISAQEISIGLLQDGVRRGDWTERVGDTFSLAAQVERNWDGPRAWDWDFQKQWRGGLILNAEGWLTPNPQAGDDPLYEPSVTPEPPSRSHPLTHVSPRAAAALAELLGCRLPTAEEWGLALRHHEEAPEAQPWNLRDEAWAAQRDYVAQRARRWRESGGLVTWQFPDAGAFLPGRGVAEGENAAAHADHRDGTLWFDPVDRGAGENLTHMIGNAAELVTIEEGSGFAVIGASALSPPELGDGTPLDPAVPLVIERGFNQDLLSYSDVGFRVVFPVGRVRAPFSRSLSNILNSSQYRLAGGGAVSGVIGGNAGVAPLGADAAGEGHRGLEHRSAERVTRREDGSR